MNTNYKPRARREDPIQEEISRNIGSFSLSVTVEKDEEMTRKFSHIPNFIAFKTTLSKGNTIIGIGTGASVLNRLNKFLDRTVLFAKNASLVDAMVRSTKILDALSLMPANQKEDEVDLEGRDRQTFFNDEDMPQVATDKQRKFLEKLVNEQCDDDSKKEYLKHLESPYLSKFDCSELIQQLMPVK